jgi:hypothetical protein
MWRLSAGRSLPHPDGRIAALPGRLGANGALKTLALGTSITSLLGDRVTFQ